MEGRGNLTCSTPLNFSYHTCFMFVRRNQEVLFVKPIKVRGDQYLIKYLRSAAARQRSVFWLAEWVWERLPRRLGTPQDAATLSRTAQVQSVDTTTKETLVALLLFFYMSDVNKLFSLNIETSVQSFYCLFEDFAEINEWNELQLQQQQKRLIEHFNEGKNLQSV